MNDYVKNLGFDTTNFEFHDLFSTEDWAQQMIQQPVLGVIFIFPCTKNHYEHRKQQ